MGLVPSRDAVGATARAEGLSPVDHTIQNLGSDVGRRRRSRQNLVVLTRPRFKDHARRFLVHYRTCREAVEKGS